MIRRVAFFKAIRAGVSGAIAWEAGARLLIALGVPLFDITHTLGTMVWGDSPLLLWWPTGLAMHSCVGAVWAIFYAYFYWSTFEWRPAIQGLSFTLIPTLLAGIIMVPQMGWMHPLVLKGDMPHPGLFAVNHGWGGPLGIVIGHAIYGLTMGAMYVRPVGFPTRRRHATA